MDHSPLMACDGSSQTTIHRPESDPTRLRPCPSNSRHPHSGNIYRIVLRSNQPPNPDYWEALIGHAWKVGDADDDVEQAMTRHFGRRPDVVFPVSDLFARSATRHEVGWLWSQGIYEEPGGRLGVGLVDLLE